MNKVLLKWDWRMFRFVCSFFGLSIYSVLVYIGARIAQLLDHLDDGRWHSNVMKYIEPWQFATGFVLLVCTAIYHAKWVRIEGKAHEKEQEK